MDIFEQCQKWNEEDNHQAICDALEQISPWTPAHVLEYVRAQNNLALEQQDEDGNIPPEPLLANLKRLMTIEETVPDVLRPRWLYINAWIQYALDRPLQSFALVQQGIELVEKQIEIAEKAASEAGAPEKAGAQSDADGLPAHYISLERQKITLESLVELCEHLIRIISMPFFPKGPFNQRAQKAWAEIEENFEALDKAMQDYPHQLGFVLSTFEKALSQVFSNPDYTIRLEKNRPTLRFSVDHIPDVTEVYKQLHFIAMAPKKVREKWTLSIGWPQEGGDPAVELDSNTIHASEVLCAPVRADNGVDLYLYSPKLLNLPNGMDAIVTQQLLCRVFGSTAASKHASRCATLTSMPDDAIYFKLNELPAFMQDAGLSLDIAPENMFNTFEKNFDVWNPTFNGVWRTDMQWCHSTAPRLILDYFEESTSNLEQLQEDGATAGFFILSKDDDKNLPKLYAFEQRFREFLESQPLLCTLVGEAKGALAHYLDLLVWDFEALAKAVDEWLSTIPKEDQTKLSWHTFCIQANPVRFN